MGNIPSIGNNRVEIYREWERLDRELNGGSFLLVGFVPGYGVFCFIHGKIARLYNRGIPTYEYASQADLDEIDRAILSGTFQVECRPKKNVAYDFKTWVYHQATGKPLQDRS